jgi:hypothetical protein
MDNKQVIERATKKVGSIGKLAMATDWDKGAIAAVKNGTNPMPPDRAAQLAEITGDDAAAAYFAAAKAQAKSETARKTIERVAKSVGVSAVVGSVFFLTALLQPNQAGGLKGSHKAPEYTMCTIIGD